MSYKLFCNRLFLCLFLLVCISARGQRRAVEDEIADIMKRYQAVGLSVAVVRDGSIIYTKAFGLKDRESNTPLRENDLFRIASISKSFSATSIMQLIESHKARLNDDFSDLVGFKIRNPRYPGRKITLRMVMSHTSSINDSQGYFNLDVINPAKNKDWAKCYNDYEPGKGYQYCNLNYNMVGAVIERLSGDRFDVYVKNHVLRPLNLYGGYCVDSLDSDLFTTLYEYDPASGFNPSPDAYASRREQINDYVIGYSTPIFSPTGGMKISAPDLAKYMIMHMNKGVYEGVRIISRRSAKAMQKKIANELGYGLAIMNREDVISGKVMTGHTGNAYGLYSAMFFQPRGKFGFVVITNGCNAVEQDAINPLSRAAINVLYDAFIRDRR
jgi:CubicO group peptidase (beta-lactamase class C family)